MESRGKSSARCAKVAAAGMAAVNGAELTIAARSPHPYHAAAPSWHLVIKCCRLDPAAAGLAAHPHQRLQDGSFELADHRIDFVKGFSKCYQKWGCSVHHGNTDGGQLNWLVHGEIFQPAELRAAEPLSGGKFSPGSPSQMRVKAFCPG